MKDVNKRFEITIKCNSRIINCWNDAEKAFINILNKTKISNKIINHWNSEKHSNNHYKIINDTHRWIQFVLEETNTEKSIEQDIAIIKTNLTKKTKRLWINYEVEIKEIENNGEEYWLASEIKYIKPE